MGAYEDYLNNLQRESQRQQQLESSLGEAATTNPDEFANMVKLSRAASLEVNAVSEYKDVAQQAKLFGEVGINNLWKDSPRTAAWLSNPIKAKISSDDVQNFVDMERTFAGTMKDIGVTALKGGIGFDQAIVGLLNIPTGGHAGKAFQDLGIDFARAQKILDTWYSPAQQEANKKVREAQGFVGTIGTALENPSVIAHTAVESLPQMIGGAGIARGLIAKFPTLAPWIAGAVGEGTIGAGSAAEQIRSESKDELLSTKQTVAAIGSGAVTGAFGALGGKVAQKLHLADIDTMLAQGGANAVAASQIKGGFLKSLVGSGISEGVFEELPQSAQEQMWQNWATDKPIMEGVGNAAALGMLTGAAMGGTTGAATSVIRNHVQRVEEAQRVENSTNTIQTLGELASANKVRARDAETFKEWIDQVSDGSSIQNVYINAETLQQSGLADRLAEISPSVASQLPSAAALNTDIEIPVTEYLTQIAPTELGSALIDDLRPEGETMTRREAREFIEKKAEELETAFAQQMEKSAKDDTFIKSAKEVEKTIFDQLKATGAYTDAAARVYSQFTRDFFVTQAANLNALPAELYKEVEYKVAREQSDVTAQMFNQDGTLKTDTPAFQNWFGESKVVDADGKPLMMYHGTLGDFNTFNRTARGIFVTADREFANDFARNGIDDTELTEGGNVMPVYVRAERPFDYNNPAHVDEIMSRVKFSSAVNLDDVRRNIEEGSWNFIEDRTVQRAIKDAGFDSFYVEEYGEKNLGVFEPTQIKSVFNEGTFDPNNPNILKQSATLRSGKETLKRYGLDPNGTYKTREIAAALEARQRDKYGTIEADDRSPEALTKIAKWMTAEVEFEMQHPEKSGVGWYSQKFQRALDAMAQVFPELATDKTARNTMTALIAITSDGQKVVPNFAQAMDIYGNFRESGKFTTERGHIRQASINTNMQVLQRLYDQMGAEAVHEYLMQEKTVSELKQIAKANGGEMKSDYQAHIKMPMAAVEFGPKLGAFYANLMGSHGYLTMDRWWSRTFNRYRGILLTAPTQVGLDRFKQLLGKPKMSDDEAIAATVEYRNSYEAKGYKNGTEIEKAANTIYKAAFEALEDAPFNATDRTFMLDAVNKAQKSLAKKGYDLSIADIQAILWYYEKRLYGELGARQSADISYEEAARRVVAGYAGRSGELFVQDEQGQPSENGGAAASGIPVGQDIYDTESDGVLRQSAYHGSPHTFEHFSLEHVGKGEGAQAYGWGLYFAQNRGIASNYYRRLAGNPSVTKMQLGSMILTQSNGFDYTRRASENDVENVRASLAEDLLINEDELHGVGKDGFRDYVLKTLDEKIKDYKEEWPEGAVAGEQLRKMLERNDALSIQFDAKEGGVYSVDIPDAAMERMILWDKPLSEQPKNVQEVAVQILKDTKYLRQQDKGGPRQIANALKAARIENGGWDSSVNDGEILYRLTAKAFQTDDAMWEKLGKTPDQVRDIQQAASEYLGSLGIPGLQYWDAGSRTDGEGTFNIVVWDQATIDQLNKQVDRVLYQKRSKDQAKAAAQTGEARGGFDPKRLTTILNEQTDYSTFLHETGHFFLTAMAQLAEHPKATAQMKDDMQTVLDWFGVKDLATWNAMSLEEQRPFHEQWAYNYELYLFDNKAPSIKLQTLFDKFSAWLKRVYKSIRDDLNAIYRQEYGKDLPILTGEVRQVMDRMLASDDQIKAARQVRGMVPLYQTQEESGMDDATWAAYQEMAQEDLNQGIQDLTNASLRQMKWLGNARSKLLKEMQRNVSETRKEVRSQVAAEVEKQPIHQAIRFLKTGERVIDGEVVKVESGFKLSTAALEEMYAGEGDRYALFDWSPLGKGQYGMVAKDGMHPDIVAEMFGFQSGDQLVKSLVDAPSLKEAIEARTDQRMLEEYSDLSDPKAQARAVEQALHNEARARFVAVELRHAAKATQPVRVMLEAARMAARRIIEGKLVRDTKASEYSAAETRAFKASEQAMKKGDEEAKIKALQSRLLNNQLAKHAADAQEEIEKGLRYFKKVQSDRSKQKIGADYNDQIDALLERFDLKPRSLKEIDQRASLNEWVNAQTEAGYGVEITPELLRENYTKHYKNMTVGEFRDLVDAVKQIEHMGRNEQNMLTQAKQVAYQAARDEIVTSINDNARGRTADTRTPTTNLGIAIQGMKRFWASHIKAATMARILDGGKDGGPMWQYFIRTANEKSDLETSMRSEATQALTKIMAPILEGGKMGGKGTFFSSIGRSLNRQQVIAIALNMGNEGNIQRLMDGEGWSMQMIQPVLSSLTESEWRAVQAVWDYLETYRPKIAEKERRIYGKEPKWVDPQPLTVRTSDGKNITLMGGYYPIKYDPASTMKAESFSEAEEAKRQLQGAFTSSTTRRSFTKSRVAEVKGRPLLYSLAALYSGVNDVIHDLAWHEWLIDANKLLRSNQIDEAIRTQYGPEWKQQLKKWVEDVAVGERLVQHDAEIALNWIRQGVSAAGLGFNVMSAIQQLTGFTSSIVRVGPGYIGRGIAKTIAGRSLAFKEVNDKSAFMANRARTQFRELNELRNQVQGQTKAKRQIILGTYFLMARMQRLVDVPTWIGAYEKAIGQGNDEDTAIGLADQAVIDSQGGGQLKDLSRMERASAAMKLFTVFYSYMNTQLNLGIAQTMTAKSRGKLAADYAMLFTVPMVLTYALKAGLTPGGDDEWDWEKIAKDLAAEQLSYLMGMMVFVRELSGMAKTVTGAEGGNRDYSGPAGLRAIADIYNLGEQAKQGEFDTAFRKAAINVVGDLTGLPSAQVNRTINGIEALAEGDTSNPAAVVLGYKK